MVEKLLVINVLQKDSFDDCRIKGSIHVPLDTVGSYAMNLAKDQKIVFYCASYHCSASHKAWHLLHDMGFKDVWVYEGGMAEWYQKGYPTEGACQKDYLAQSYGEPEAEGRVRKMSAEDLRSLMQKSEQ